MTPDINKLRGDLGVPVERPYLPVRHDAESGEETVPNPSELHWGWTLLLWTLAAAGAGILGYYVLWPLLLMLLALLVAVFKIVLFFIVVSCAIRLFFD